MLLYLRHFPHACTLTHTHVHPDSRVLLRRPKRMICTARSLGVTSDEGPRGDRWSSHSRRLLGQHQLQGLGLVGSLCRGIPFPDRGTVSRPPGAPVTPARPVSSPAGFRGRGVWGCVAPSCLQQKSPDRRTDAELTTPPPGRPSPVPVEAAGSANRTRST